MRPGHCAAGGDGEGGPRRCFLPGGGSREAGAAVRGGGSEREMESTPSNSGVAFRFYTLCFQKIRIISKKKGSQDGVDSF